MKRLITKALKLFLKLLHFGFIVSLVILVRLLKPIVLIRFGPIRSDVIGHYVFDPEYYLCEREIENRKTIDFFYFEFSIPPNEQWTLMLRRHLRIGSMFRRFDEVNRIIPGWRKHFVRLIPKELKSRDLNGLLSRTELHIRFTSNENIRGKDFLNKLGLKPEDQFVCLIVRDSAYKEKWQQGGHYGNRDWSYHNYRDSDIDTYKEAAEALAEKGYWVFRMGKKVHKEFEADHTRIVDYANSRYRSDFLDIWLMANCFFCISTGTGLDEVSRVFRRPAVYVNDLPLQQLVTYDHVISSPKHLFWENTNTRLTLFEHLDNSYFRTKNYESANIKIVDLTPEEIREAVLEMELKLSGKWQDSFEDRRLQDRFWKLFKSHNDFRKYHGIIHPGAKVGAHFLRNNPEWLN